MAEELPVPRLRPIEAFPLRGDGQDLICLRDPSGLAGSVLTVSRGAAAILALLDGTRTLGDLQAEVMRRHGALVYRAQLAGLVETLDQHLFLESPRFETERVRLARDFAASPVRSAIHAGKAYEAEAAGLTTQLDGFFVHPDGPGPPGPWRGNGLQGLIAPHIDFHRGGPAYAWAYKSVAEASDADCFIVFGTAHAGLDGHAFAATRKPYATPLGAVEVDQEVLDALVRRAPGDPFGAEIAHRTEHSIEFQAVCLAYLQQQREQPGHRHRPVRIVPLLVSFVHECLARGVEPASEPAVAGLLDAVRDVMATVPRRYCLVAGADLAHVGPRFGDPQPVSRRELDRLEVEDRALLSLVAAVDPGGLYALVAQDGDRRRICGLSSIYAVLATLPAGQGRLLHYGQWPDPEGTVSFASMSFEEDSP